MNKQFLVAVLLMGLMAIQGCGGASKLTSQSTGAPEETKAALSKLENQTFTYSAETPSAASSAQASRLSLSLSGSIEFDYSEGAIDSSGPSIPDSETPDVTEILSNIVSETRCIDVDDLDTYNFDTPDFNNIDIDDMNGAVERVKDAVEAEFSLEFNYLQVYKVKILDDYYIIIPFWENDLCPEDSEEGDGLFFGTVEDFKTNGQAAQEHSEEDAGTTPDDGNEGNAPTPGTPTSDTPSLPEPNVDEFPQGQNPSETMGIIINGIQRTLYGVSCQAKQSFYSAFSDTSAYTYSQKFRDDDCSDVYEIEKYSDELGNIFYEKIRENEVISKFSETPTDSGTNVIFIDTETFPHINMQINMSGNSQSYESLFVTYENGAQFISGIDNNLETSIEVSGDSSQIGINSFEFKVLASDSKGETRLFTGNFKFATDENTVIDHGKMISSESMKYYISDLYDEALLKVARILIDQNEKIHIAYYDTDGNLGEYSPKL